jgi:hypothetical protein
LDGPGSVQVVSLLDERAALWDHQAEPMMEVLFDEAAAKGPSELEIEEFARDLARRFPDASASVITHLARLWEVYSIGAANGLSFKHSKSQLCQLTLRLLGMVVQEEGVGPDPARIRALQEWPAPRTKGQLREFFGSINWVQELASETAVLPFPAGLLIGRGIGFIALPIAFGEF